ncbi:MAG: hypothetical protein NT077_02645 [Candidatus Taylorbacteria bacterium]|nr:hypothetical protein [Candidatus Taylorbacteria bacterium]
MNIRSFDPLTWIGDIVARIFHLEKFGRKMLSTSASVLAFIVTIFLVHFYDWAFYASIPACAWALWRYVIRYFRRNSYMCVKCGRLKCDTAGPVCHECEKRGPSINALFAGIDQNLANLREAVALHRGDGYPQVPTIHAHESHSPEDFPDDLPRSDR